MALEITEKDGATVVALSGDVDLQTSPAVRQGLLECLETPRQSRGRHVPSELPRFVRCCEFGRSISGIPQERVVFCIGSCQCGGYASA